MANTIKCEYCGRTLEKMYVKVGGNPEMFCGYEPCKCEGARAYRERELEQRRIDDSAREREELELRLSCIGIPPLYYDANDEHADKFASDVVAGKSMFISGNVGVGKTYLAAAVAKEVHNKERTVSFTSMGAILDEIKLSFNTGVDAIEPYRAVYLLVLDDLGKENVTPFALERLFTLVDYRNTHKLPIIVTSQYKPGYLIDRLARNGDYDTAIAIVSRIRQNAITIELTGNDRRV